MNGRHVVITGATSGIGRATALALGRLGASLLLVSRDESRGAALVRRLSDAGAAAVFVQADLTSLAQIRAAAGQIRARWPAVDVLINNAGARFDTFATTAFGCERTFATNHLGHFLLTGLLLDQLIAAPAARIITVTSSAAAQAHDDGRWHFAAADYDRKQAYAKSKLANLLFTFELARRLEDTAVQAMAVDPGVAATRFARNNGLVPWLKHLLFHTLKRELTTPAAGADTVVFLASVTKMPPRSGNCLFRHREAVPACPAAHHEASAAALWALSVELVGLDPSLGAAWSRIDPATPRSGRG